MTIRLWSSVMGTVTGLLVAGVWDRTGVANERAMSKNAAGFIAKIVSLDVEARGHRPVKITDAAARMPAFTLV